MNIIAIPMTNENIDYLIKCEKNIIESERKDFKNNQGHKRNNFNLLSADGNHKFHVFMRINETFNENFSIGLVYHPINDKGIMLFRCNGPHNHEERQNSNHHNSYHYHIETEDNILEDLNPMYHSVIVDEYATFKEAFQFFVKHCNIKNAEEYFLNLTESVFSFMEE